MSSTLNVSQTRPDVGQRLARGLNADKQLNADYHAYRRPAAGSS
jgi:hypothetical protein